MSVVFADERSLFFVGGRGDQSGRTPDAGGCTKAWWDAEVAASDEATAMAKLMTATGGPIITLDARPYTAGIDHIHTNPGGFAGIEVGMVVYVIESAVPGIDVDTGRYKITDVDPAGDWIECSGINGTGNTNVDIEIGGAFDELDTAIDETYAQDHSVWIYTNLDETLAAAITIFSGGHALKNLFMWIIGFNTIPGDMSLGGAFYESPYEILKNGSIAANKCVTLDADSNAFVILDIGVTDNLIFENLHLTNTTARATGFAAGSSGIVLRNCRFSDLNDVINTITDSVLFDSCYSHDNLPGHHYNFTGENNLLIHCVGKLAGGTNLAGWLSGATGAAIGNLAVGGLFGLRLASAGTGTLVMSNTFYNTSTYGITMDGADSGVIFNNIFCLAPGAIGIYMRNGGSTPYNDHNCFIESDGTPLTAVGTGFAGGEEPTIGENSIETDPLFTDPADNDFSLKSNSPCRRTGKPTIGAT